MIVHFVHEGQINFQEDIMLSIDIDWDVSSLETTVFKEGFQPFRFAEKGVPKQPRCAVFEIVSIKILPPNNGVDGGPLDEGKIEYAGRGFGVLPLTHRGDIIHGLNGYFRVPTYSELYVPTILETLKKVDPWSFVQGMESQQALSPLLNLSLFVRVCVPQLQVDLGVNIGLATAATELQSSEQHPLPFEFPERRTASDRRGIPREFRCISEAH